jgi:lambda repressor-like predicted transcriptional regulator
MVDKEEARRRVRVAVKGEMGRRGWNIQQLIDESGLDRSTLGDFLDGKRWPQSRTLGAVERALDWPVSSIAMMLEGGDPPAVGGDTQDAETEDELLYRRPEGLSDEEWERVKEESRGFIEWQIEKAARER